MIVRPSLALRSDFRDYYDHWFDLPSLTPGSATLLRRTTDGPNRVAALMLMKREWGLSIPKVAANPEAVMQLLDRCIVYTDLMAHRGEGKQMYRRDTVLMQPVKLAMEIIPGRGQGSPASYGVHHNVPTSYRLVCVGAERYGLRYRSETDTWRSNVGEVDIEWLTPERLCYLPQIDPAAQKWPLVAVDFVWHQDRGYLAVDLNVAPELAGTPVEDRIAGTGILLAMQDWLMQHGERVPQRQYLIGANQAAVC